MRDRSKVPLRLLLGLEVILLAWRLSYVMPLPPAMRTDRSHPEFGSAYGEVDIVLLANTDDVVTGPHDVPIGRYRSSSLFGGLAGIDSGSCDGVWNGAGHYARFSAFHVYWRDVATIYVAVCGCVLLGRAVRAVRQRLRHHFGHCPQCGYDLHGSRERCPECGTPTAELGELRT